MGTSSTTRRWYQFGLGTLFVAMTVAALLTYEWNWLRQRRNLLADGWCGAVGNSPPGLLWLFTNDGYHKVWKFGGLTAEDHQNIDRVESLFPEATIEQ